MDGIQRETLSDRLRRERQLSVEGAIGVIGAIANDLQSNGSNNPALPPELASAAHASPESIDTGWHPNSRSDVYSLGSLLYEMLTGDPPFRASSADAMLSRKRAESPPRLRTVRDTVPAGVERAALRALSRDPAARFRNPADFVVALETGMRNNRPPGSNILEAMQLRTTPGAAVAGVLLIAALLLSWRARRATVDRPVRQKLTTAGNAIMGALSPDKTQLAYVAMDGLRQQVVLRDMKGGKPHTLPPVFPRVSTMEWSPDGKSIMVGSGFSGQGLIVVSVAGQIVRRIQPDYPIETIGYWLPDGKHVSLHGSGEKRFLIINVATGDTIAVPVPGNYTWMDEGSWSPDGRVFAVVTESINPISYEIRTVLPRGAAAVVVRDTVPLGSPRWSADGKYIYYARSRDAIWKLRIKNDGTPHGDPKEVQHDLEILTQRFGALHMTLTSDGRAVTYPRGRRYSNLFLVDLQSVDTLPRTTAITTGTILRWSPVVSPDGSQIAFAAETDDGGELFTMPLTGGTPTRVTTGARVRAQSQVAWSPDGSTLAFGSVRAGVPEVLIASVATGKVKEFPQTRMSIATGHLAWAPGALIAYQRTDHSNITLLDPSSGSERNLLTDTLTEGVHSPRYSPDGKKLAFLWLRYPPPYAVWTYNLSTGKFQRLQGGVYPIGWTPDGQYVLSEPPVTALVTKLDARGNQKPKRVVKPPFREAECTPAGPKRPNSFICAAFNFVSDIWQIENFDSGS